MDIQDIVVAVAAVVGGLLAIAAAVVKLTPNKKDDEILGKIQEVVEPLIDAVDGEDKSSKE